MTSSTLLSRFAWYLKQLKRSGCMCGSLAPGETCANCLTVAAARLFVKNAKRESQKSDVPARVEVINTR